ncbi:MAG TPA: PAS domain-containing protein, partial [Candidatus Dormibacteraeota bacterium]|nr:PAS domain-containing protein [Candidatus Dormibacteraeota bacterium]
MTVAAPPDWRATLRGAVRPPLGQWRFWIVQALVILLVALHAGAAVGGWLRPLGIPPGATLPLLLLPVLYASLNFGLTGSLATAAWVTVLMVPTLVLSDSPAARWVDAGQLLALDAVAAIVGHRIAREAAARRQAAAAARAHQQAEARYRALFGSNQAPILVTDMADTVAEANPAAARLFGRDPRGLSLAALLGPGAAAHREGRPGAALTLRAPDGAVRALRVEVTTIELGDPVRQVVLEDVTAEVRDHRRVQSYAARMVDTLE